MNSLSSLISGSKVFIIDVGISATFDKLVDYIAIVYDDNQNWYTVHIDNLATIH